MLNPDAYVETLGIEAHVFIEEYRWKGLKDKIIAGLKTKGFKMEDESENYLTFTNKQGNTLHLLIENGNFMILMIGNTVTAAPAEDPYEDDYLNIEASPT